MPSIYLCASVQEENIGADGISEEARMFAFAKDLGTVLQQHGLTVYMNKPEMDNFEFIGDSNSKHVDLHLALHTNAGGGSGTETWCYQLSGTKSSEFGAKLQKVIVDTLGLPDRGIKDATIPGHRWADIVDTTAPAVLTELFFHDNPTDLATFKQKRSQLIYAMSALILEWFGMMDWKAEAVQKALALGLIKQYHPPTEIVDFGTLCRVILNLKEVK